MRAHCISDMTESESGICAHINYVYLYISHSVDGNTSEIVAQEKKNGHNNPRVAQAHVDKYKFIAHHDRYYLENSEVFLDNPGEFFVRFGA